MYMLCGWCLATTGVTGQPGGPGGSDTLWWHLMTTGVQILLPAACLAPPRVVLRPRHWLPAFTPILRLCSGNSSRLSQYTRTPRMTLSWFYENNQKMKCSLRQI